MTTDKALDVNPYVENPHVQFDAGKTAPSATPGRGSRLCEVGVPRGGRQHAKNSHAALPTLAVAAICCVIAQLSFAAVSPPILVRGGDGLRLWQTSFIPNSPLDWHWGNSVSGRVTVVCHVERTTVDSGVIERGVGEKTGSYMLPTAPSFGLDGKEYLYDVSLTLFRGDGSVSLEETARIVCLPAAVGGTFELVVGDSDWPKIDGVRVAGYDSTWREETASAESVSISGTRGDGSEINISLCGTSGYEPIDSKSTCKGGGASLFLDFSTLASAWSAVLRSSQGLSIIVR